MASFLEALEAGQHDKDKMQLLGMYADHLEETGKAHASR